MILEHNNNSGKVLGEGGRAAGKESGGCVQEEMVGCGRKDGLRWRDGEEDLIYLRGSRRACRLHARFSSNVSILGRRPIGLDVTGHRKAEFTKKEGVSDRFAAQTGVSRSMSQEEEDRFVERETFILAFVPCTSYS